MVENFLTIIEESGSNTYIGKAPRGSATSSAVWQIQRINNNAPAKTDVFAWADSSDKFDFIWDDRATYTYG